MRIGIIDLLGKEPPRNGYSRLMRPNNTSIMAQVVGVWCEEEGHDVHIAYYSGPERLAGGIPDDIDLLFINAFSQCAMLAYGFSKMYQARGVPTVLGGPHARSYPEDSRKYFDYVVGFCDKGTLRDILADAERHPGEGVYVSSLKQPSHLPGLRQRWKFLKPAMDQAKVLRLVPIIGSLGCPYKCSFCIDAVVGYEPMETSSIIDDVRFFQELNLPRSVASWHDPNFAIRFDETLDAVEEAVKPGSVAFLAEMSLALLGEDHLKRLKRNNFQAIAPGIESWFDIGDKSRMRSVRGMEKVQRLAEHANLVNEYIPYTQCNLIFGLDADEGPEPFELTKKFIDLAPGVYPHYAVLSAFGRNAVLNLEYQRADRVVPVPFHFMDLVQSMNVRPKNYGWVEFYDHVIDTMDYSFRPAALLKRSWTNRRMPHIALEQAFRGWSSERNNRTAYHRKMRHWLAHDPEVQAFMDGRTREVPRVMVDQIRTHLGPLWQYLPEDAVKHDPQAFLHSGTVHPLPVLAKTEAAANAAVAGG